MPTLRTPTRPAFLDTHAVPWTPWVMDGTHFKLLNVDRKTGGFTMLLKVDPDNAAPVHGHLGAVEAYVIDGGFAYEQDAGGPGSYVFEAAGSIHQPTSPEGSIMFAVVHREAMMTLARANDAAGHLGHLPADFD